MAAWPSDGRVRNGAAASSPGRRGLRDVERSKGASDPARHHTSGSPHARLAMILVAGKYIARGSPLAQSALELVGAQPSDAVAEQQLEALRQLVEHLAPSCPPVLQPAIDDYLSLVAEGDRRDAVTLRPKRSLRQTSRCIGDRSRGTRANAAPAALALSAAGRQLLRGRSGGIRVPGLAVVAPARRVEPPLQPPSTATAATRRTPLVTGALPQRHSARYGVAVARWRSLRARPTLVRSASCSCWASCWWVWA